MPQMGVSVTEGTLVQWCKQVGDRVEVDETICEISTDKIDTEVPAPVAGIVAEILVPPDGTVAVGVVLARIAGADGAGAGAGPAGTGAGDGAEPSPTGATPSPTGATPSPTGAMPSPTGATPPPSAESPSADTPESSSTNGRPARGRGRHSPVVQRIAAEHGIDLKEVAGSGRGGRVRKQDVLASIDGAPGAERAGDHLTQLSRTRRQIGEHMKHSLQTAAHCTTWAEVDMSAVETARARLRLTALPFVARASVAALQAHPALNAWLEDQRYTRHEGVNLGIAVSLGEDGLIVPVVHDAHELSAEGLGARIRELARRARARELTPDEVQGATFTITNPGQYGSIMATPIINQPQVAILDLEAVLKRPVVLTDPQGADSIAIRPITILGLSWDHRALDGAQAAQFLASVKGHLEAWSLA